ncbi:MAG: translation initiation factor IF-3 [Candidatus Phytoplasma stylosanthis]|uniref:translation initiation factor IF-3 n=1 Tax=Candidatus Phytoplasma stylosanthis TaxID=2798314 RepID=UPI00293A4AE6|nr:translation initiation factor IF-3 [Candidatus Phytoplasma stylosanthis]MDV3168077.1 translation initiation factor IF-3 [Candidatus Phytoplasma stylosanthis]MDV3174344.1 translation initiation factor IF-3 [Candidatus Phytoplasma stylosanthis]MDV3202683.1 translation initiation factor IF-3 [Candidatus Phytoplasma stylosanthis]
MNVLYNESIPNGKYLTLDENGSKLGILEKEKIVELSEEKETDIVMINSNSEPKVVRLMNYSQFRYKYQKKLKEMKKNQVVTVIKEIRINPNIDNNDLNFKTEKARLFLNQGNKVKIIMRFKGRMITHVDLGKNIFEKIILKLNDLGNIEIPPKLEFNRIITVLSSKKNKTIK